jgi:hypothetical protein
MENAPSSVEEKNSNNEHHSPAPRFGDQRIFVVAMSTQEVHAGSHQPLAACSIIFSSWRLPTVDGAGITSANSQPINALALCFLLPTYRIDKTKGSGASRVSRLF